MTFQDSNLRAAQAAVAPLVDADESYVTDARAQLTPSEHVEQKLLDVLKSAPIFVSHVQRVGKPSPR